MAIRFVYLECHTEHVAVAVRLNDLPVITLGGPKITPGFVPIPTYLVEGPNVLSCRVLQVFGDPPAPQVRLRVAELAEGQMVMKEQGVTLALLEGGGGRPPPAQVVFAAPYAPPAWAWLRCPVLDASATPGAEAFAREILQAYAEGRAEPFLDAAEPKLQDMAIAFPSPSLTEMREAIAQDIGDVARPVTAPEVAFARRPCAGGRLLECLGADGRPFLRRAGGEHVEMLIGKLDGRWRILR